MAKRKRIVKKKSSSSRKPIGFTKVGKKYALVFGTKTKPRLGKSRFSTKKSLLSKVSKR